MRNATGGRRRQASALLAMVLGVTCSSLALAGVGPFATARSADEVMVVLDGRQNPQTILTALAAAGYSTLEPVRGLPPQMSTWRRVQAPNDPPTRQALLAIPGVLNVLPVYRSEGVDYPILTNGQLIVKFVPGTTVAQVNAFASRKGLSVDRQIEGLSQVYVFSPTDAATNETDLAAALATDASVVYAHPSLMFKVEKFQVAGGPIEDPLYPFQWHLKNTQQLPDSDYGHDIHVEEAWNTTLGAGAIVAVLDDCLQRDHEDLRDNYLTGQDFLGETLCDPNLSFPEYLACIQVRGGSGFAPSSGDGDPSPAFGPSVYTGDPVGDAHGTAVAGLIAGSANRLGGRGVAPLAKLIGCRFGLGPVYTIDQDIADAFLFSERNGAMVINNSWGGPSQAIIPVTPNSFQLPNLVSDAIDTVSTIGRGGKGVLVTFAAGNTPIGSDYANRYSNSPNVMTIGATMRNNTIACYSSYGDTVSVVAPSGGLLNVCLDTDMTTSDVQETPCFELAQTSIGVFTDSWDTLNPGFPCRGYNPPMKFLDAFFGSDVYPCPNPLDPSCIPLVQDFTISDFPQYAYTHHFGGTSAACPVASGVAALVFSVNTGLTAVQVRGILEHTADRPAGANLQFDTVTGFNKYYAHGRVNAARAVRAATLGQSWPAPVKDIQNVSSQALARLFWTNPTQDVASVLVVRGTGNMLDWVPQDGINYIVGQTVAPGVTVVANDVIEQLDQTGLDTNNYQYALFVRNGNNFYSWGRRTSFAASSPINTPVVSALATPRTGSAPLAVHFTGGSTKPQEAVAYVWDFGDGRTGSGAVVDHTYTKGGTYTAKLSVTNKSNLTGSTTVLVEVVGTPNVPPTVTATATPTSGDAPLIVVFRATATDSDGTVVSYSWNFGDGSTGSGQTVEHIYLVPGTYAAVLTVTDNSGAQNYASQTILVGGTAPTAAATDPPNLLTPVTSLCGAGVAPAAAISLISLALVGRRRRF